MVVLLLAGVIVALVRGASANAVVLALFSTAAGFAIWLGRRSRLPQGVIALLTLAFIVNAGGWAWNLYVRVRWYDEVAHTYSGFVFALVTGMLVYGRMREAFREHRAVLAFSVGAWGLALGALWELLEWLLRSLSEHAAKRVGATLQDTLIDLACDGVGSLVGGALALHLLLSARDAGIAQGAETPGPPPDRASYPDQDRAGLRPVSALRARLMRWLPHRELRLLVMLLVPISGVWFFAELADEVLEGDTRIVDHAILLALRSPGDTRDPLGPLWFEEMMRDLTALGSFAVLVLVTGAVAGYLVLRHSHRALWLLLSATCGGVLLSWATKEWFGRPRPDLVPHLTEVMTPSFPSGHSTMAAVVYLTLAVLLARLLAPTRFKTYMILVALGITLLVGLSRVYVGVHYPTDVLAGWALGLSWAMITWFVAAMLQRRGRVP